MIFASKEFGFLEADPELIRFFRSVLDKGD